MEENPFQSLKISSSEFLNSLQDRSICPKCLKSRKFYCYNCFVPVKGTEDRIPKVKLPLKIDIIKHPNECDGKSTSAHAAVLAPDDVHVYTYPCIPEYPDQSKVVLVFPGKKSLTLEEMANTLSTCDTKQNVDTISGSGKDSFSRSLVKDQNDTSTYNMKGNNSKPGDLSDEGKGNNSDESKLDENADMSPLKRKVEEDQGSQKKQRTFKRAPPFERAIFIDSTWKQTKGIIADDRLKDLTCVQLKSRETKFWRHQKDNPATYLSTIEAVYYLVRDYHDLFVDNIYDGEYDNLLFFFNFMYQKIRTTYDGGKSLKAYKQRAKKNCEKGLLNK
ncbi:tRNA-uridine aminocarboxypropyltransferase 1-like [Saccostrea echinata]|uniref:tRNA-uridine aminocarboxypropyltransferase 1-like n=1 Tax=Saccostrea echinata TaxID=191078 RepID=UPI002A7EE148|nr:tRNA-uridine aminocarboxypropyltransferase 1-like [Saccostrea echinata]